MHSAQFPPLPSDYVQRMPRYLEATSLIDAGFDSAGRRAYLTPTAADAWRSMKNAALDSGLNLILISAFRSYAYQEEILQRKLSQGISWTDILSVSAFPSFSEHHTGRAIDIGSPNSLDLTEAFAHTAEFEWLFAQATIFGFHMSYPQGNLFGIAYEPWHWAFQNAG
jgi:D-alanyl-D-alanine carboxypeptidase